VLTKQHRSRIGSDPVWSNFALHVVKEDLLFDVHFTQ
jgi:hypothetical protein